MDFIEHEYFMWLCNYIKCNRHRNRNRLLEKLHEMEYKYFIDFDRNRAKDGIGMRRYFAEDTGYDDMLYKNMRCSVLEMLVGMSVQMQNMTEDVTDNYKASNWFWKMLDNLELSYMTNTKYAEDIVETIINIFMDRTYARNGEKYNIFILNNVRDDLTKVELWYQMCWYIEDVYI